MVATPQLQAPQSGDAVQSLTRPGLPRLRAMGLVDIASVVAIEARAYRYPWGFGVFRDCLRAGYVARVLERQDALVAYGIMSVAAGEAHLLNLCVDPDHHGQGLASRLLAHLMESARRGNAALLFLEVRPSNRAARELYRRRGFETIGRRKRYYPAPDGREDALVLAKHLGSQAPMPTP